MFKLIVPLAAILTTVPALACDDAAHLRAVKDQARAMEQQAEALRQIERIERDRNKFLDRQAREARR